MLKSKDAGLFTCVRRYPYCLVQMQYWFLCPFSFLQLSWIPHRGTVSHALELGLSTRPVGSRVDVFFLLVHGVDQILKPRRATNGSIRLKWFFHVFQISFSKPSDILRYARMRDASRSSPGE